MQPILAIYWRNDLKHFILIRTYACLHFVRSLLFIMLFSKEDIEAWKAATRNVRRFLHMYNDQEENVSRETFADLAPPPAARTVVAATLHIKPYIPDLQEGEVGRMDKNNFGQLKRGKLKVDLAEDLHGMNVFDARLHFYEFIKLAHASNKRSILLITGKGFVAPSKIRASLANWINDPDLKPLILAYCRAQPKDGGEGAFYIYLSKIN